MTTTTLVRLLYALGVVGFSVIGVALAFDTVKTWPMRVFLSILAVGMAGVWFVTVPCLLLAAGIMSMAEREFP